MRNSLEKSEGRGEQKNLGHGKKKYDFKWRVRNAIIIPNGHKSIVYGYTLYHMKTEVRTNIE